MLLCIINIIIYDGSLLSGSRTRTLIKHGDGYMNDVLARHDYTYASTHLRHTRGTYFAEILNNNNFLLLRMTKIRPNGLETARVRAQPPTTNLFARDIYLFRHTSNPTLAQSTVISYTMIVILVNKQGKIMCNIVKSLLSQNIKKKKTKTITKTKRKQT